MLEDQELTCQPEPLVVKVRIGPSDPCSRSIWWMLWDLAGMPTGYQLLGNLRVLLQV